MQSSDWIVSSTAAAPHTDSSREKTVSQLTTQNTRPWWTAVVSGMASYIDAAAIVPWALGIAVVAALIGGFSAPKDSDGA